MKHKSQINVITEGAIYVAIYGVLTLMARFIPFLGGSSGFVAYILPLPIALYAARRPGIPSLICALASIAVCFIYYEPIYILIVIIPNIIAGYLYGLLEVKLKQKFLIYLISFILILAADFLSVYLASAIGEVDFFEDSTNLIENILNVIFDFFNGLYGTSLEIDITQFAKIIKLVCIITIIVDAGVKTALLALIFRIMVSRLKLLPEYDININLRLVRNPIVSIIYLVIFIVTFFVALKLAQSDDIIIQVLFCITATIYFVFSLYLVLISCTFFNKFNKKRKTGISLLIVVLNMVLFTASIAFGFVLNFIKDKK